MLEAFIIKQRLQRLPDTPDKIAQFLAKKGISGTVSTDNCPIANYLGRSVRVTPLYISFGDGDNWQTVTLSSPVREFVRKFDDGQFPGLRK